LSTATSTSCTDFPLNIGVFETLGNLHQTVRKIFMEQLVAFNDVLHGNKGKADKLLNAFSNRAVIWVVVRRLQSSVCHPSPDALTQVK